MIRKPRACGGDELTLKMLLETMEEYGSGDAEEEEMVVMHGGDAGWSYTSHFFIQGRKFSSPGDTKVT